jgi:hypothetical protein
MYMAVAKLFGGFFALNRGLFLALRACLPSPMACVKTY